jgi:hypothetical protein
MKLQHLLGPIKAMGIYDPKIQRIVQRHCERGLIAETAEVVVRYFFDDGVAQGYLPAPAGKKTKELFERMCEAARKIAEEHARRGVLCAKGFYPPQVLMLDIIRVWEEEFRSYKKTEGEALLGVAEADTEELAARRVLATNAVAQVLLRHGKARAADEEVLEVPMKDLEALCVGVVGAVHRVFQDPDAYVHELHHGPLP